MRLIPQAREIIRPTVAEVFGQETRFKLFGLRSDDSRPESDTNLRVIDTKTTLQPIHVQTATTRDPRVNTAHLTPSDRFITTQDFVAKEMHHLDRGCARLFAQMIDSPWVEALADQTERAKRRDAFESCYGRLQHALASTP